MIEHTAICPDNRGGTCTCLPPRPPRRRVVVVRRGITRTVWLVGRWAVKVPSLRAYGGGTRGRLWSVARGLLANQCEAEWYENAPPDDRPRLCPVLRSWFGGFVNVYPRCRPVHVDENEDPLDGAELFTLGIDPGDNKYDNFGWLGTRLVRMDYDMNWNGCPHDRSGFRNEYERSRGRRDERRGG